ncbi:DUF3135 domain-containing protein [Parathalassolituus penaei]|uniref:DUF3135 domain-containing protein n=1 Tax=Parathalassolituus penaei TaxID=2997323 RepID=A0A9X3EGL5_9GAMM|nr:DUF3135 domain-containing protein [Parathalassolituus penaei]MCY0966825.1 DUF3135 domain-containing protein [Parathalassolituus penaei]
MQLPSFDELKKLAASNPEQLEKLRAQLIEDTISKAPEQYQRRLRGLQFQIDMERRRARTPMASCIRISKMMHDHLHQLRTTVLTANGDIAAEPAPAAQDNSVILFSAFANR